MKNRNFALLLVVTFLAYACVPYPSGSGSPMPTYGPTSLKLTATLSPFETAKFTPFPTLTETFTPSPTFTETSTSTETATSTSTETSTPTATFTASPPPNAITIPGLSDWDAGSLAFSHGSEGEWDFFLWGGFANSLIKKGDTYYLYYQGSPSYDNQCDSVAQRSIGVATSTDGIQWVKSANNPVITWSGQGSIEEGAASSAAWLGADGKIYIYYGANTGSGCSVNASARLAVSEDGVNFQDVGEVLSGRDPTVWGSGDEIFPVGIYSHENQWYLYYVPNGVSLSRKLGVAIGVSPIVFTQSMGVNDSTIHAWGPVSIILEGLESVLITNPNDGSGSINIYRFSANNPAVVQFQDSYTLSNCNQASVLYESIESGHHWMISCRDQNADNYYIRNAFTP